MGRAPSGNSHKANGSGYVPENQMILRHSRDYVLFAATRATPHEPASRMAYAIATEPRISHMGPNGAIAMALL